MTFYQVIVNGKRVFQVYSDIAMAKLAVRQEKARGHQDVEIDSYEETWGKSF